MEHRVFAITLRSDRTGDDIQAEVKLNDFKSKHADVGGNLDKLLLRAAEEGNIDVVRELVDRGADVDYTSAHGWTPVHRSAVKGCVEIARILLAKNANLNSVNVNGATPLCLAVDNDHFEIVKLLIEHGADPTFAYNDGVVNLLTANEIAHQYDLVRISSYLDDVEAKWIATKAAHKREYVYDIEPDWNAFIHRLEASPSPENLLSPLFQLDIDCFELIFDWISVKDLDSVRKMCRRLKQVVDFIIKEYYPGWPVHLNYIKRYGDGLVYFYNDAAEVVFHGTIPTIENIQQIGKRIQKMHLCNCDIDGNFYDAILKHCVNLTNLIIEIHDERAMNTDWLTKIYPKLRYVTLNCSGTALPIELCQFFDLNPSIQTFSTSVEFLSTHIHCFEQTTHKLDHLDLFYDNLEPPSTTRLTELLTIPYSRGFYQRLRYGISVQANNANHIQNLASLPGIENLCMDFNRVATVREMEFDVPVLPHIKELQLKGVNRNINWVSFATQFPRVERVFLWKESNCFVQIVLHFPTVKHVAVDWPLRRKCSYRRRIYMDDNVIDLNALNEERAKLGKAHRITIYVHENIYLATKWTTSCMELQFVAVKRIEAYDSHNLSALKIEW